MENIKVCAVIVTYNRVMYLMKLLDALISQNKALSAIFIFDNNSNDGTDEYLLSKTYIESNDIGVLQKKHTRNIDFYYYRNQINSGGAGGFHDAVQYANTLGYDFLWIMDDDVLPDKDCLQQLLLHQNDEYMITIPNRTGNGYQDYAITNVDMKKGAVRSTDSWKTRVQPDQISNDTIQVYDMAFEGPLINNKLINLIGLPNKELFILFDDSEYAMRASKATQILFVKDACLLKQIIPSSNNKVPAWKLYYHFRNATWFNLTYGETIRAKYIRPFILCFYWWIKNYGKGFKNIAKLIKKGYKDGIKGKLGKRIDPADYS